MYKQGTKFKMFRWGFSSFLLLSFCLVPFLCVHASAPEVFDNYSDDTVLTYPWGKASYNQVSKYAYKFFTATTTDICEIQWRIKIDTGSPSDDIYVKGYTENGDDAEDGDLIFSWTADSSPTADFSWINFSGTCEELTASSTTFFVLSRETLSDTDYYVSVHGSSGSEYSVYYNANWYELEKEQLGVRGYGEEEAEPEATSTPSTTTSSAVFIFGGGFSIFFLVFFGMIIYFKSRKNA